MFDQVGGGEEAEQGSMALGCVLSWLCFPISLIALVVLGKGRTARGALIGGTLFVTLMVAITCANFAIKLIMGLMAG